MTREDELLNAATLAPPPTLREGIYQPTSITGKDATLLATISKNTMINVEKAISNATQLVNDLKLYKECLIDHINIEAEILDVATKYGATNKQQSYTLPGITSVPSLYNIEQTKTDNARMETLKGLSEKADSQKQMTYSSVRADFKELAAHMKKLAFADSTVESFISSMNSRLNPNF